MKRYWQNFISVFRVIILMACIASCSSRTKLADPLFEVLDSKQTGLEFSNDLAYTRDFNLFTYMYFYNGSGIGAADFNNDGLTDLFFGSNQHDNKLYLNTGGLHFKDATK